MWWISARIWIKKYWKWVLFPIGILLAVGGFLAGRFGKPEPPTPPDFGKDGEEALDAVEEADRRRDERLAELREKNQARLEELSKDQQEELEELEGKPIEEVVAWFDKL